MARYHAELLLDIYDNQNKQLLLDDACKKLFKCCGEIENYKMKDVFSLKQCLGTFQPENVATQSRAEIENIRNVIGRIHSQAESDVLKFLKLI